jgi:cobalamin biosynthesis Mg chelatase CobN
VSGHPADRDGAGGGEIARIDELDTPVSGTQRRLRFRLIRVGAILVLAVAITIAANVALLGYATDRNDPVGRLSTKQPQAAATTGAATTTTTTTRTTPTTTTSGATTTTSAPARTTTTSSGSTTSTSGGGDDNGGDSGKNRNRNRGKGSGKSEDD